MLIAPEQDGESESEVTQLCLTLCDLMDCSMPGFAVLHCLPEFAQIHVQSGYTILNSNQYCEKVPVTPRPCQCLVLSFLYILTILVGVL